MVFSNASLDHLPLSVIMIHMLILHCFCLRTSPEGGTFSLSCVRC
jgi:hypothetical protein